MSNPQNKTHALYDEQGRLRDILVFRNNRLFPMLGSGGAARELAFLPEEEDTPGSQTGQAAPDGNITPQKRLPVLLGSGAGPALEAIVLRLEKAYGPDFHLAVVDKEEDILAVSGLRERFAGKHGIVWISERDPDAARDALSRLQAETGYLPLLPVPNPMYLRLDRAYYNTLRQTCEASAKADIWSKARYAKFTGGQPRILLLTSSYFLIGEFIVACERLEVPHRLLRIPDSEFGKNEFIEQMLTAVLEFKPDFVLTINHLGIDREGVLTELLEKLRLPLASWFVDNPHLILYMYSRLVCPWVSIFTWDADNLASLTALGFEHVVYLPLGVDAKRFAPPANGKPRRALALPRAWNRQVSFVGNSMVYKVRDSMERAKPSGPLADSYREIAAGFGESNERSVARYLEKAHQDMLPAFDALPGLEQKLCYESLITWEATLRYRLSCITGIMPFAPLITGDKGWFSLLDKKQPWHYHNELNYYDDLPSFYPCAAVNFNCTSKQMKGAVNQRVFDVPATGSFLLTDYREQMENLFEPGKEIICYHSPEEATALTEEFLKRPKERAAVANAARKRILAEHCYEHRLRVLISAMRERYT